jgi:DNA modification methylase
MKCINEAHGENWSLYNGDACELNKGLPDNSVDLCVHSPPFSSLYIYSDSEADMGNCKDDAEFIEHYKYLIGELYRVTVTGRLCVVHCKDLPKYANRDDTAGLKDFPGMIVDAFESAGWSYHSHVTIWKCPVTERERTNNNGLLHKTVLRDRSQLRQGMADFLKVFRKPPQGTLMSDKPIAETHRTPVVVDSSGRIEDREFTKGFTEYIGDPEFDPRQTDKHPSPYARGRGSGNNDRAHASSIHVWRRYAEPVWWDIDQMDVLNYKTARDDKDERHICPLQLGVIERAVDLWSLPGEVVLSPFAGIGSEGVGALRRGRKFVGFELKGSYFDDAIGNLERAERLAKQKQRTLFPQEA